MQTRRDFIQSTALGAGAFTLGVPGAFAKPRAGQPPIRFIFMTKSNGLRPHELALPGFSGEQKQADTKKDPLNVDLSRQQLPEWMSVLDAHKNDMAIIQGLSAKGIACGHAGNQACLGMFKTGERRVLGNVKWATVDVELGRLYPSPFQHVEVQTAGGNRGIVAGQAATGKLAYNYAYADPKTAFRELFKSVSNDKATRARIDADSLVLDYLSNLSATNYNNVEGLERLKMTRISQTIGDIKDRDRQIDAISDQILKNIPDVNEADLAGDLTTVEKQEAFAKILVSAMRAGLTNSALFTLDTLGTPYTGIPQLDEGSILNLHNLGHKKGYAVKSADEVRAYIRIHHMRLMAAMVAAFKRTPEGNGTMFDNTVITYQAENGETHHSNGIEQPIIMLAGKNAKMNFLGNYVRLPGYGQPGHKTLGNWYTTHLNNHGNPIEHYGQLDPELNQSDPENIIDESGMRVSGNRNDYRNWSSLPATKDTWHEANWFATTHSRGPWTILDLGSVCDLETISIWSCNPGENVPYRRSATKLDVYVRKDQDRNNTHENLAAFNPKGWTLRDLKRPEMNIVIGRIGDYALDRPSCVAVRKAQREIANEDPRGAWVDVDDLNDKEVDGKIKSVVHYTREGYKILGQRFARQGYALVTGKESAEDGRPKGVE